MTVTSIRRPRTPKAPVQETVNGLPAQEVEAPAPVAQTAEVAQVTTRYTHPVYIASQHKLVHPGEVCPAKWEEGSTTLAPSLDLVGKI